MCQPITIQGKIINELGEPVPSATIKVKRGGTATASNTLGEFELAGMLLNDTLIISAVGYHTQYETLDYTIRSRVTIILTRKTSVLDEAVIIAYGTTTRRMTTGSISKVSAIDIARQPVLNPLSALEGRVPGLTITHSSGVPGSSIKVQLRGQSSFAQGSEPLFIIDGVPFAPGNSNINQFSSLATGTPGSGLSPFAFLNPSLIQSIEVLKDADATAIYGSRGANGVIIITTKKAQAGKTEARVNISQGWNTVTRLPSMLNTQQYLQMRHEAFANDGLAPSATDAPDLYLWDTTRYTNFAKLLWGGTATTTRTDAALTGGSASTRFGLNLATSRQTTVFPGSMHDNTGNVGITLSHIDPSNKLSLALSASYALDNNNLSASGLESFINLPPNTPQLYNPDGSLNWEENGFSFENPLAYTLRKYEAKTTSLLSNLRIGYQLLKDLWLRTSLGYNTLHLDETSITPVAAQDPSFLPLGAARFGNNNFSGWIAEPQVSYGRTIGKLKLDLLAGATWQQNTNTGLTIGADGYTNDGLLKSLAAAPSVAFKTNTSTIYRYTAAFGRITASLNDKYILNLSGRRDGSSRFGPARRFANFGALGGAWIFSNEKNIQHILPFISFGKLRASWGITGNDQIGDYKYLDAWNVVRPYQNNTALAPSALFNPSYGWETVKKLEAALDLGFCNNRMMLSASWYRNRSSSQLAENILPSQTGFFSITANLPALIQNTGFELELSTNNIISNGFSWTTTANISIPRNTLLAFPGLETSAYASMYTIGQPLSTIKKLPYAGVDPHTGVFTFEDHDKNGSVEIPADFVAGRYTAPTWFGGFGNTLKLKNWELHCFLVFKKQWGANYLASLYGNNFIPGTMYNQPVYVFDRWQHPGQSAPLQKFTTGTGPAYDAVALFNASSGSYGDASFARLKTLSLSYSLPSTLLNKIKMQGFTAYVHAQNLFTFTSYKGGDPETGYLYALPPLKNITCGIQITF
jgi:TonB-linked SusC/RagA family outer membrane protein